MTSPKVSVSTEKSTALATPLFVLPLFEGEALSPGPAQELNERMGGALARLLGRGDFRAKKDDALAVFPREGELSTERVLLVGLGKRGDFTVERVRRAAGVAVRQAQRLRVSGLTFSLALADVAAGTAERARAVVEGALLGAWELRELKSRSAEDAPPPELESVVLVANGKKDASEAESGARVGEVAARSANLARDLAERPGNLVTPSYLVRVAEEIAQAHELRLTVLDRGAMEQEGLGALLSVARGSEEEPRLIVLEYRNGKADAAPLGLVGKGVTFDSGGISIKPAQGMEEMKYDMSGAAAVLGALRGIAELKLAVNVVAVIPATENLPSGRATKPGDVVRSHLGKTIEVINTDAEGRLILADALSYMRRFSPAAVLDAATLTGACVVALGHHATGIMGNNDALIEEVRAAGERAGERCWPLPLWDEYRELIDSTVADLKNSGGRPAGAITGGWFLKEFAREFAWAHLDIAGTAWGEGTAPYLRKGATGVPTRLLLEWVRTRAAV